MLFCGAMPCCKDTPFVKIFQIFKIHSPNYPIDMLQCNIDHHNVETEDF